MHLFLFGGGGGGVGELLAAYLCSLYLSLPGKTAMKIVVAHTTPTLEFLTPQYFILNILKHVIRCISALSLTVTFI